jgi:hypothetical protein
MEREPRLIDSLSLTTLRSTSIETIKHIDGA